jgi:hypothetical protein
MEMEMTTLRRTRLVLAGLLLAGAAACTANPGTTPGQTASPTPPPPPCPVGSWRSTGVSVSTTAGGQALTFSGGAGAKVTIGDDGKVMADFSGMQPVVFSTQAANTPIRGEISYQGAMDGTVDLSGSAVTSTGGSPGTSAAPADTSGAAGRSGAWRPTGTVNEGNLQITVKLTQPVATTILNKVKVSDVTGAQTTQAGDAVDLQPLLRAGTYRCGGQNTLVITTSASSPTVMWSLTRA